jgi:predicted dehydrogenase
MLNWTYGKEIEEFVAAVLNNHEPPITGHEARDALQLVLAAYESSKQQQTIRLE